MESRYHNESMEHQLLLNPDVKVYRGHQLGVSEVFPLSLHDFQKT